MLNSENIYKMEKPANTNLPIHEIIKKRWSPRSFEEKQVNNNALQRIFEAARWAPSSYNEQPWRFIVGRKGDNTYSLIFETLAEFNQKWSKLAPVLVICIGKTTSTKGNKPNRVFQYDLGQSVAYITFQATHEGLFVHQMGGFDAQKAQELFQIPDDYQAITVFALGYKGDASLLEEDFIEMEKSDRLRKPLEQIVFEGKFGETAKFQ